MTTKAIASRFTDFCTQTRPIINQALAKYLHAAYPFQAQNRLQEAMTYSSIGTSKQYRPLLTIAAHKLFSDQLHTIMPLACAIEMIHSYSLIHDDLPAMDNDVLRRGKPTCHIKYDEATAILAGDTLQCLAFEILAKDLPHTFSPQDCLTAIIYLCKTLGVDGMAGGQQMDLDATNKKITDDPKDYLTHMHQLKTGALIRSCIVIPAILNEADADTQKHLTDFATHLGLLFQIADDILDESPTADLGKTTGKDSSQNKLTYIQLYGMDTAKIMAKTEANAAKNALSQLKKPSESLIYLNDFVDFTIHRNS